MVEIKCPFCNKRFRASRWNAGKCPNCHEEYWWEERHDQNYTEVWDEIYWAKWDRRNE